MDRIKNDRQLAITQDKLARARRSLVSVITKISDPARRDLLVESIEMTIRRLESEIKEYLAQKGESEGLGGILYGNDDSRRSYTKCC